MCERLFRCGMFLAVLLAAAGCDSAQPSGGVADNVRERSEMTQAAADKSGSLAKLDSNLIALYRAYEDYTASGGADGRPFDAGNGSMRVDDGLVLIDAVADSNAEDLKRDLEAIGLVKASAFGRVVSGRLPIEALPAAADLPSLRFARASQPY